MCAFTITAHNYTFSLRLFFCFTACCLSPLDELNQLQVRGRNQRHGHWLSSEHICPPAAHVFTPDPSQVTVWVALSLLPLHYPPPPFPFPTVEEIVHAARFSVSHTHLDQTSENPSHLKVIKVISTPTDVTEKRETFGR